jgi:hypothetical protein
MNYNMKFNLSKDEQQYISEKLIQAIEYFDEHYFQKEKYNPMSMTEFHLDNLRDVVKFVNPKKRQEVLDFEKEIEIDSLGSQINELENKIKEIEKS